MPEKTAKVDEKERLKKVSESLARVRAPGRPSPTKEEKSPKPPESR